MQNRNCRETDRAGDELRFVLLTSGATVADYNDAPADAQQSEVLKGLKVALSKAEGEKCPRCWHYTQDVGKVAEHAESAAAVSATSPVTVKNVSLPDESIDLFNRATLAVAGVVVLIIDLGSKYLILQNFALGIRSRCSRRLICIMRVTMARRLVSLADSGGWQRWFFAVLRLVLA
ncbi:isoleucyl-tRNA synthetase [Escherichia coli]|uniref:Isoleucyl-tRNA synthetase n=1 Tax=Escherichia coli TaxID=562 RepID=A0A376ZLJ2_ECOLX|nr:isoleucyl-tRNA synthetase [Escherichia coli]